MSHAADSLKSVLYALGANFAIALAKSGGAAYTGSSAMLAEAIHSFADCGNQGLLLWGMRRAGKAPTADHPLGYGKAVYFWSFIVALMLFSMGGLFSIYEGAHKLGSPEPMKDAWVALAILGFGIVAESVSLWGALREIDKERGRRGYWAWFRGSRTSELVVIFGEDLAALGGLVLAFGFIVVALADRQSDVGRNRLDRDRRVAGAGGGAGGQGGRCAAGRPERRSTGRAGAAAASGGPARGAARAEPDHAAARPRRDGGRQSGDGATG